METDSHLRVQLPPTPGWARNTVRTGRFPTSILAPSYRIPAKTRKCLKKKSIGSRWRGEHLIFLKAKSFLTFEKRVLGQFHLTGSSTPLLMPVFTAELCGFLLLVPLVIWVGMVPGFCFPSSSCTFMSPATASCKSKS